MSRKTDIGAFTLIANYQRLNILAKSEAWSLSCIDGKLSLLRDPHGSLLDTKSRWQQGEEKSSSWSWQKNANWLFMETFFKHFVFFSFKFPQFSPNFSEKTQKWKFFWFLLFSFCLSSLFQCHNVKGRKKEEQGVGNRGKEEKRQEPSPKLWKTIKNSFLFVYLKTSPQMKISHGNFYFIGKFSMGRWEKG